MIAIRADANPEIGAGHVMRCLSIAAGLQLIGEDVVMITADSNPTALIKQAKTKVRQIVLHTDWRLFPKEAGPLLPILKSFRISLLLIDSYLATPSSIEELKQYTKIACLDDLLSDVYPADLLINYNITSAFPKYEAMYGKSETKFLLGTKYAPLRPEFCRIHPRKIPSRIKQIFLSAGGADSCGFVAALTDRLLREKDFSDMRFLAAPGVLGTHGPLQELSRICPRLELVEKPEALKRGMEACDAAVSAGGLTLYELCACGAPTAVFSAADNQVGARKAFGALRIMADCGDLRDGNTECLNRIVEAVRSLENPALRASMSKRASQITDGFGAVRIAQALASLSRE
jgi:UDP-2,4-diacetamido-2,4,6-trideoxy-beta-L-altropyranose hydrolase